MGCLPGLLSFSFLNEYIQILNCVHNSPSWKTMLSEDAFVILETRCIFSLRKGMETGALLSVCQGREKAKSNKRGTPSLAGRQGDLPGNWGQLSHGEGGGLFYSLLKLKHLQQDQWIMENVCTKPVLWQCSGWFQTEAGFCQWVNDTDPSAPCDGG